MDKILEMRQKRAALVKQAREILDRAETEKRDLTAEEEQQYNRIMEEVDRLGKAIEREERQLELERELAQSQGTFAARAYQPGDGVQRATMNLRASDEYRDAFWLAIRLGLNALDHHQARMLAEVRALATGTDTAGGYLVPEAFEKTLIQKLAEENVMRTLATVITSSNDRNIPVEESEGTAYWTDENAAFQESDISYGQRTLRAHKLTTLIKVSEELLQDSAFNLEGYISAKFAQRMGAKEEEGFLIGNGTNQPRGVVLDAEVGVTAAASNAITADEIIDLYYSLRRPYRRRGTFMMNDKIVKVIRKLKDNDGQYIWQPGLQAGEPDRLLGRPVVASAYMPEMADGQKIILFGDFSYYWIADRQGRMFQRLGELFAVNGQVGFRAWQRVDGLLTLPEAVKALRLPTA